MNNSKASEVYEQEISVVDISTTQDFMTIAGGDVINGENSAATIYSLKNDLDFTGVNWTIGSTAFRGLLNGMGHTVSNLTINTEDKQNNGIFYKVSGGTIMNIKFDNISISSTNTKTGIVSECDGGGYFYNIQMTNIDINSTAARAGALIGQISKGYVYVEQVYLNNSDDHLIKGAFRVGGIIGFAQQTKEGNIDIKIIDCLVSSKLEANYEVGGIFGTYEAINAANKYYLDISYCAFTGVINVIGNKTFAGGILGYQKEAYAAMTITHCVSVGKTYFNNAQLEASTKNCSGIVGGSASLKDGYYASVNTCYANMEEFNSNYEVTAWNRFAVARADNYKNVGFDVETKWNLVYVEDSTTAVQAPYLTLNFLSVEE